MKRVILFISFIVVSFFIANFVSATISCSPTSLTAIYTKGSPAQNSTVCSNDANVSVSISKTGNYFTIDQTIISQAPAQKTITTVFDVNAPKGLHFGSIDFSDGSPSIPISFFVEEIEAPPQGDILVFPTSKILTVQQGQEKTQNILITVPNTYPRVVTIQSVDFNPGTETIRFGDLNLGQIAPGNSISIPIVFSGINAQVGIYQTGLSIFAIDSEGQIPLPTISLQLQVTAGVTPVTNETFSLKPSCSLSAITMNLNETYTLTCSNVVQNIEVNPQYNEYLEGLEVDLTSGIYTYRFKAVKFGSTNFLTTFSYKGSPLFSPFIQEIKINPSGVNLAGSTYLKVELYQNNAKKSIDGLEAGITSILILDNVTNSVIDPSRVTVYLNGEPINSSFILESGKTYELRASAVDLGYVDTVLTLNLIESTLELLISPSKEFYTVGETLVIENNANASLLFDNAVISSPYTLTKEGIFLLKAVKSGYTLFEKNITVETAVTYSAMTPQIEDWKKGREVRILLNKNANWSVYKDSQQMSSGQGNLIEFKLEGFGIYEVKADGITLATKNVEDKGFLKNTWNDIQDNLTWWIIGGVVVLMLFYFIFLKGRGTPEEQFSFQPQPQT